MKDYYSILGIKRTATQSEVKTAYRQKAMQYHPDRNGGSKIAADKFREAKEAYDTLSDAKKRATYDSGFPPTGGTTGSKTNNRRRKKYAEDDPDFVHNLVRTFMKDPQVDKRAKIALGVFYIISLFAFRSK